MQDLERMEKFQNLLRLDKIDRLKQSMILNFHRKETRYSLMLKFLRGLIPSCLTIKARLKVHQPKINTKNCTSFLLSLKYVCK